MIKIRRLTMTENPRSAIELGCRRKAWDIGDRPGMSEVGMGCRSYVYHFNGALLISIPGPVEL